MINSAPSSLENSDPSNQTCLLLMGQCWTDITCLCFVQLLKKENITTSTGLLKNEISGDCTVVRWTHFPTASQNMKWLQLVQVMSAEVFLESIIIKTLAYWVPYKRNILFEGRGKLLFVPHWLILEIGFWNSSAFEMSDSHSPVCLVSISHSEKRIDAIWIKCSLKFL